MMNAPEKNYFPAPEKAARGRQLVDRIAAQQLHIKTIAGLLEIALETDAYDGVTEGSKHAGAALSLIAHMAGEIEASLDELGSLYPFLWLYDEAEEVTR